MFVRLNNWGTGMTNDGFEQLYGRFKVGVACHAAGIAAIDTPFTNFKNIEAFDKEHTPRHPDGL